MTDYEREIRQMEIQNEQLKCVVDAMRAVAVMLTLSFGLAFLGLFTFYEVINPYWDLVFRGIIIATIILLMERIDKIRVSKGGRK